MAGPGTGVKALTIVFVSVLSWYTGIKFWKPIVIEHLKEENRLRTDIEIEYDENAQPKSWEDLRTKVKEGIHPSLKQEEQLQENLRVLKEAQAERENEKKK